MSVASRGMRAFQDHLKAEVEARRQAIRTFIQPEDGIDCIWKIYTDGSCPKSGGPGGWATVIVPTEFNIIGTEEGVRSGPLYATTNNIAELTAIYDAMAWVCATVGVYGPTHIITDSQYCLRSLTEWLWVWEVNRWRGCAGQVKNLDLFKKFIALLNAHPKLFKMSWVKGHSGDRFNDMADKAAGEETKWARENEPHQ